MSGSASQTGIARRYARALADLCDTPDERELARGDIDKLVAVFAAVPEATRFLANPTVRLTERREVLDRLLASAAVPLTVGNFCRLLLDKGRFDAFNEICAAFVLLLDERAGRKQAHVESVVPLSADMQARLRKTLGGTLGREVELTVAVVPELVGGLRVRVGHTIYDTSIRNHLDRLRERLTAIV